MARRCPLGARHAGDGAIEPTRPKQFRQTGNNHEAVALCRRVAALETIPWQPIMITGPSGSGKTHLLNCIAQQLRGRSEDVVLACVSPVHFPSDLRALLEDPRPLESCERAVLLVDGLERYEDKWTELREVMGLFLRLGHTVVTTSSVHPAVMQLPDHELHRLLEQGQCIPIRPSSEDEAPTVRRALPEESLAPLLVEMRRRSALAALSERSLRRALAQEQEGVQVLQRELSESLRTHEHTQRQLAALRRELEGVGEEHAFLNAHQEDTRPMPAADGGGGVHESLARLRLERDQAVAEAARLRRALARALEREQALRVQLSQSLERTTELLQEMAMDRQRLLDMEKRGVALEGKLSVLTEARRAAEAEVAAARALADSFHVKWREAQERLDARLKHEGAIPRREHGEALELARDELVRARMEMDALVSANGQLLDDLEEARASLARMGDARNEEAGRIAELQRQNAHAQAQTASAKAVIDDLQNRLDDAQLESDKLRVKLGHVEGQRDALARELEQSRREGNLLAEGIQAATQAHEVMRAGLAKALESQIALKDEVATLQDSMRRLEAALRNANGAPMSPGRETESRPRMGEILCSSGFLSRQDLESALAMQSEGERGERIGAILMRAGLVSEDVVLRVVASQSGVAFVRLRGKSIAREAAALLSAEDARRYRCIPIEALDGELTLAVADPLDSHVVNAVRACTRRKIRLVAAPHTDIEQAQAQCYAA